MRFIDQFDVILLDMMDTFMFGGDRFGEAQRYDLTYRAMGGNMLSGAEVQALITHVFKRMALDYSDISDCRKLKSSACYLGEALGNKNRTDAAELDLLDRVFAAHEVGKIPVAQSRAIIDLSRTHRLGVVSNIWGRSDPFRAEIERAGLKPVFENIVFSSDHGLVKPSAEIFQTAIRAFGVPASRILFVGDDPVRDVAGARSAGLATALIARSEQAPGSFGGADLLISDLTDLTSLNRP